VIKRVRHKARLGDDLYEAMLSRHFLDSLKIAGQALAEQIRDAVHETTTESIRKLDPDRQQLSKSNQVDLL
jgi:hypothetical protein